MIPPMVKLHTEQGNYANRIDSDYFDTPEFRNPMFKNTTTKLIDTEDFQKDKMP
jgi:hypothetical protein